MDGTWHSLNGTWPSLSISAIKFTCFKWIIHPICYFGVSKCFGHCRRLLILNDQIYRCKWALEEHTTVPVVSSGKEAWSRSLCPFLSVSCSNRLKLSRAEQPQYSDTDGEKLSRPSQTSPQKTERPLTQQHMIHELNRNKISI